MEYQGGFNGLGIVSLSQELLNSSLSESLPPPPPPPPSLPSPPSPPPVPVVRGCVSLDCVKADITSASSKYNVGYSWLLRVADCESHLNVYAHNSSGATGLFQFKPSTYSANGGSNLYDPVEQSDIAAKMFSQGLAYEWSCH